MAITQQNGQWIWRSKQGQQSPLAEWIESLPTPFYLYDLDDIEERLSWFQKSGMQLHYAMKANANADVLKVMLRHGVGVDVVSLGELNRAIEIGFQPQQIVFSGVGKSHAELEQAIQLQIAQINVESEAELRRILMIAQALQLRAPIAFRLNPDVEASTHPYIKTGFREHKFGLDEDTLRSLIHLVESQPALLDLRGITVHIGSQIRDLKSFREAFLKAQRVFFDLKAKFNVSTFDMGGGLGIDYHQGGEGDRESVESYLQLIQDLWKDQLKGVRLLAEPGRILVARAGALVTRVEYVKNNGFKNFAIVDTGMHHLLRPSLYQAFHRIEKLKSGPTSKQVYDVVGPICESSDVLGASRDLPTLNENDILLILDAGAYGSVMSSRYNLHEAPKEYVIENGKVRVST